MLKYIMSRGKTNDRKAGRKMKDIEMTDKQALRENILTRIDELDRLEPTDEEMRRRIEERKKELRKALSTTDAI